MIYKVYVFIHMTAHSYLNYEHAPSHPYTPNVRFVSVFDEDDDELIRHLTKLRGQVGVCGFVRRADARKNASSRSG